MNTNTPNTIQSVRAAWTWTNDERIHYTTVSLSRFTGDVEDVDAIVAHCQKVMQIVKTGARVIMVGPVASKEA